MDRQKMIIFLGSVFVFIMFISSYASGTNNNLPTTSTTTTIAYNTFFVAGEANAVVVGYSSTAAIRVLSNDTNDTAMLANVLSGLESNGSVSNYVPSGPGYTLYLSRMTAYELQQLIYKDFGINGGVSVNATTKVAFPAPISLFYNKNPTAVDLTRQNYTVQMLPLEPIGSNVALSIKALILQNGTVFNNQITLARA